MYAITFDIDTLHKDYKSYVYEKIKKILEKYGFDWKEYSVYTSNCGLNDLHLAIEELKSDNLIKKLIDKIAVFTVEQGSDFRTVIKS